MASLREVCVGYSVELIGWWVQRGGEKVGDRKDEGMGRMRGWEWEWYGGFFLLLVERERKSQGAVMRADFRFSCISPRFV